MQDAEFFPGAGAEDADARRPVRKGRDSVREAARRYGIPARRIIDFSTTVNPFGPPASSLRAARKAVAVIGTGPAAPASELGAALAGHWGLPREHVVCGNGPEQLLHLLPRVFRPRKVLVPSPANREYVIASEIAGCEVVPLRLPEHGGFRVDPLDIVFALKDGVDMVFLSNPGDPTGRLVTRAEMLEIARYAQQKGVRMVVDESFMDYEETDSLVRDAADSETIVCLRSFSRFFGMPGLPVGYAVCGAGAAGAMRNAQEPYPLSAPAAAAATAAVLDRGFGKRMRKLAEEEREWLLSEVRLLPGVETFPSFTNFLFLRLIDRSASALADELGSRGLLISDCASYEGMGDRYVRISIRSRHENRRLLQELRSILLP